MAEILVPPGNEKKEAKQKLPDVIGMQIQFDRTTLLTQVGLSVPVNLGMAGMMVKAAELWLQDQIAAARIQSIQAAEADRQQNAAIMGQLRTKH